MVTVTMAKSIGRRLTKRKTRWLFGIETTRGVGQQLTTASEVEDTMVARQRRWLMATTIAGNSNSGYGR